MSRYAQKIALFFFSLAAVSAVGQGNSSQWTEVSDQKLGIALMLPSDFLVDNEERKNFFLSPVLAALPDVKDTFERPVLYAFYKSLSVEVRVISIRQTSKARDHLWLFLRENPSRAQDFKVGRFVGRKVTRDEGDWLGTYVATAVGSRIVTISAWAKSEDRSVYEAFLRSLVMDAQTLFPAAPRSTYGSYKTLSFDELSTSTQIREALQRPDSRLEFEKAEPLANFRPEPTYEGLSRPMITLREFRRPPYLRPEDRYVGTVKAKVRFLADGSIGRIEVFGDAPKSILRNIHSGIREMKFLPAQKNGRNIEIVRDFTFEMQK